MLPFQISQVQTGSGLGRSVLAQTRQQSSRSYRDSAYFACDSKACATKAAATEPLHPEVSGQLLASVPRAEGAPTQSQEQTLVNLEPKKAQRYHNTYNSLTIEASTKQFRNNGEEICLKKAMWKELRSIAMICHCHFCGNAIAL